MLILEIYYQNIDTNNRNWLEAIKNFLTKNIQIKIIEEIKSNNIVDLIKYIKNYVDYNIKNINNEENKIDNINELMNILKGTDFDIKTLLEIKFILILPKFIKIF